MARPKRRMSAPATRFSQRRFSSRRAPATDALAPSATKTIRKPAKKRALAIATWRVTPRRRPAISSKVTPLTVER
jgi:hypothetical protein